MLPDMSKISLIAKLTAADGKADELEVALRGVVEAAAEEEGLEVSSAHAAADEPGVYYFFELYRDQAAMDVHGKGDAMRTAMGAFGGLLAGRPEITMMSPVAGSTMSSAAVRPRTREASDATIWPASMMARMWIPLSEPQSRSVMMESCATSTRRRVR